MDDPGGDEAGLDGKPLFDVFAWLTYTLFGNSFLVVAGGAVGGMTLMLVVIDVAWTLNAGTLAFFAGLIAIPVGYVLAAWLVRRLIRRSPPGNPVPGQR